ncbi:MAG: glycosyltransferase [Magnetococcales bacterium]|nr:glycosyltransferase [Magnetococcales bacterium]
MGQIKVPASPMVSVIMNCLNCAKYLNQAIDSVYSQSFSDWEIIFWDNGSNDDSAKIAKSYDERLKYFRASGPTVSLGEARNLAIEQSSGKYLAFLDCDDYWLPQKLEKQIALFTCDNVGLVFSNSQRLFQYDGSQTSQWNSEKKPHPKGEVFSYLLTDYPIVLSTAMVKKQAFTQLDSLFDPALNYSEEYDLFLRIAYGWLVDYVDEPLTVLRIHSESMTYTKYSIIQPEIIIIIEKLGKIIPDFDIIFQKEIQQILKTTAYTVGVYYYRDGKPVAARKIFKSYILKPKFFIAYLATFIFKYQTMKSLQVWLKNLR